MSQGNGTLTRTGSKRINRTRIVSMLTAEIDDRLAKAIPAKNGRDHHATDREESCMQVVEEGRDEALRRVGFKPLQHFRQYIATPPARGEMMGRLVVISDRYCRRRCWLLYPSSDDMPLSVDCTVYQTIEREYGLHEFMFVSSDSEIGKQFVSGAVKLGVKVIINAMTGEKGTVIGIH